MKRKNCLQGYLCFYTPTYDKNVKIAQYKQLVKYVICDDFALKQHFYLDHKQHSTNLSLKLNFKGVFVFRLMLVTTRISERLSIKIR